jgi:hypothetical protein
MQKLLIIKMQEFYSLLKMGSQKVKSEPPNHAFIQQHLNRL